MDWLLELEKKKQGLSIELEYLVDQELQRQALADPATEQVTDSLAPTGVEDLSVKFDDARFRNIRKYLDSVSGDNLIRIKDRDSIAPQNTGSLPAFKINFTLQSETDSIPN